MLENAQGPADRLWKILSSLDGEALRLAVGFSIQLLEQIIHSPQLFEQDRTAWPSKAVFISTEGAVE